LLLCWRAWSVGQLGPIVLLGTALLLSLQTRQEFWAGTSLVLIAVKPQLTFLFVAALLFWSIERKRWTLIAGVMIGFGAAIAIALAADASVFSQYWDKLLSDAVSVQFIPTLGGALRRVFGPAWLQLLPMAMGILWLLLHYRSHHEHWDWHEQAPILLLASVLCTPYAFLIDEVVLLPVFLHAAARMRKTGPHRWILGGAYLALNALIFGMLVSGLRVVSLSYVWTPATWLLLYLVARRGAAESKVRAAAASNI
jgi:hypothetical protein